MPTPSGDLLLTIDEVRHIPEWVFRQYQNRYKANFSFGYAPHTLACHFGMLTGEDE